MWLSSEMRLSKNTIDVLSWIFATEEKSKSSLKITIIICIFLLALNLFIFSYNEGKNFKDDPHSYLINILKSTIQAFFSIMISIVLSCNLNALIGNSSGPFLTYMIFIMLIIVYLIYAIINLIMLVNALKSVPVEIKYFEKNHLWIKFRF